MGAAFVLLICALLAVAGMLLLSAIVPEAGFSAAFRNGVAATDPVRTWAELAYFITGAALSAIALLALIFAKRQAEYARLQAAEAQRQNEITARATAEGARAEQARAYLELFRQERPKIVAGLDVCALVEQDFARLPEAERRATTIGAHADAMIAGWRASDRKRYNDLIALLTELENLGLLVRRRYYALDDVHFLLEGPLDVMSAVLLTHVQRRKAASPDGRECEHAEWLLRRIVGHVPSSPLLQ